jgi:hypothetical protein
MAPDPPPTARRPSRFQALSLLTLALLILLIFAAIFFVILVIPLAILLLVYLALIAADRMRHRGDSDDRSDTA